MTVKFPSIDHPTKYGYMYDSTSWNYSEHPQLNRYYRMYETYGDGLTQHSRDWPVTLEFAADYLLSLAAAMIENHEIAENAHFGLCQTPGDDRIAFAASVIHKESDETTPRYYSMEERKVSRSDSKRHDRRYQRIESWNNGSPDAVYRMLIPEHSDGIERYSYAEAIRQWFHNHPESAGYMALPVEYLGWLKDSRDQREEAHKMRRAYEAASNVCKAHYLRSVAESQISTRRRQIEPPATAETAEATA